MGKVALIRGKLRLAQFSRNRARADAIGIKHVGEAGFDPYAAARSSAPWLPTATSAACRARLMPASTASHPTAPQRIDRQRHARQFGQPGVGDRDRNSFLSGIDGLLFGDTPDEGYVRGTTFVHPKLGLSFTVPDGFIIDNSAAAVTAAGPGDMAVRFDGVSLDPKVSLTDYIRSGWVAGLDDSSVRVETINGNEAALARASADGWQFSITVFRAGSQVYRLLTAAPMNSTRLDGVARSINDSFRFLSDQEKRGLKPLRIRVVTVRAGETIGTIAARIQGVDRKLDLFRLINALAPGAGVSVGDKVKIIAN